MPDDEIQRLRAALAHAHDKKESRLRNLMKRLKNPLQERIQKRAIAERVDRPDKKGAA